MYSILMPGNSIATIALFNVKNGAIGVFKSAKPIQKHIKQLK